LLLRFQKRYSALEYINALLLVSGIIVFTLAGSNASPSFNFLGVVFGAASVIFDGFVGNNQEKLMKGTFSSHKSLDIML
jgi:drug/metabolite transporter (DMT)-like permease